MQNLLNDLASLLLQDQRFVVDGKLLKNKIVESALNCDSKLLSLLITNKTIKSHFFVTVGDVLVFDKSKFQKFVSHKSFLQDSFTRFSNYIGLTSDEKYITKSKDVVLAWPHKDCILEGGQSKEDQKRSELFFSETLAPDEIDRLLSPKVLTNAKKYDKDGVHDISSISRDAEINIKRSLASDTITDNLIIKGNNLLALHSIESEFVGKTKLVFIDPPYNTENDSFLYNDSFTHSTWCTFIYNRLVIAHKLLDSSGTLCVAIDHNELCYCMMILDEIFGRENLKNVITVKRGSVTGAKVINPGVVNLSDYVLVYAKDSKKWKPNRVLQSKERDDRYNQFITNYDSNYEEWIIEPLANAFSKHKDLSINKLKKLLGDSYEEELNQFVIDNAHRVIQFATLDDRSISEAARNLKQESIDNPDKVFYMERDGKNPYYILNGKLFLFASDRLINIEGEKSFSQPISDIWDDVLPNDLHNEGGVVFLKGKKTEKLLHRIIELTTNENDIILDFFIGSGTSCAVAHKMHRQYIGIEQLDYGENDSVSRLKNVIGYNRNGFYYYDSRGISNITGWNGGGSFVYLELKKYNETFVEKIEAANTTDKLITIWEEMKAHSFLEYNVDTQIFDEKIEDFKALSVDEQKQILCNTLDMNQLYVNLSEINDTDFACSEAEKTINNDFYKHKV